MNSAESTVTFSASFAIIGLLDAIGATHSWSHLLLALAFLTPLSTLAFWWGARQETHRWYSAVFAAFMALGAASATFQFLPPNLSPWAALSITIGVLVAFSMFAGRAFSVRASTPRT
jgi:hypothetical protein